MLPQSLPALSHHPQVASFATVGERLELEQSGLLCCTCILLIQSFRMSFLGVGQISVDTILRKIT
jgi:hypothetical protein